VLVLNQVLIQKNDVELANILVVTYFSMFKIVLEVDTDTRMLSALTSGVSRALPYAQIQYATIAKYIDTLFEVARASTLGTSVKALALLYQVMAASNEITPQFYETLYAKLSTPTLLKSSAQGLLLNLVLKVVRNDNDTQRGAAFIKRILAVSMYARPNFTCAAIVLLDQLAKDVPALASLIFSSEDAAVKIHNSTKDSVYKSESLCLWELVALRSHFHPAVAKLTELLIARSPAVFTGEDPLSQYSLLSFLDAFMGEKGSAHIDPSKVGQLQGPGASRQLRKMTVQLQRSGGADEPEKVCLYDRAPRTCAC
jgi:ribosome biogenesis protein MAK21